MQARRPYPQYVEHQMVDWLARSGLVGNCPAQPAGSLPSFLGNLLTDSLKLGELIKVVE